uniref:Apolipophorin-3 n=1 Tax=Schizaphis graminum TaxID=13262 RepID=A0A2S2NYS7_SCHGA
MAKFAIKALVVAALVCLVFDCGRAADTQQQGLDSIQEAAKGKMTEFMNSFKQTASETFNKVQDAVKESENTKKVESQLNSFFSGAFAKLKNTFSSTKTTNPDDLTKQEAIKAFDDYAVKHPKSG